MMIFNQEKYHVSKDGIEHIPVDPTVGPDTPISVIPAWGEVEKEALSGIPEDLKNIKWMSVDKDSHHYTSLEQILTNIKHLQHRYNTGELHEGMSGYTLWITSMEEDIAEIVKSLQNTINKGYYINTQPTE